MKISKLKLSEALISLNFIASQYNLKLNRAKDFRIAVKIIENSTIKS